MNHALIIHLNLSFDLMLSDRKQIVDEARLLYNTRNSDS